MVTEEADTTNNFCRDLSHLDRINHFVVGAVSEHSNEELLILNRVRATHGYHKAGNATDINLVTRNLAGFTD